MSHSSGPVRRPRIQEVARRAGVSVTTVSHTFSGNGTVATATQQRVRAAADELGYRPDALARGLRGGRLGVIALVERQLLDLEPHMVTGIDYFLRLAGSAALAAVDQGYGLMFVPDPSAQDAPGAAYACDGFLVTEPVADDPLLRTLDRHGIPYLSVGRDPARDRPETVVDIATGLITGNVLTHLVAGGATRVALVVGTDQNAWNLDTEAHYEGWCASHGQPPLVVRRAEREGEQGGVEAAREVLARDPEVDAVYALAPEHTVGVHRELRARGLLGRVQLVGGSDAESLRAATPPITAVDLRPEALGWEATVRLLTLIDGIERPVTPTPHGQLLLRG